MPYKEPKIEKLYYSISEVAEMLAVSQSLIRFWEKEFQLIKPGKNKKGNRMFTVQDIDSLKLIYHLVKEQGMTLKGARQKLKSNPESISGQFEIIKKLQHIKEELLQIKNELPRITEGQESSLL